MKNPAVCLKLAHANSFICMHAHISTVSRACNIVKSYITFNHYSNLVFVATFVSFKKKGDLRVEKKTKRIETQCQ